MASSLFRNQNNQQMNQQMNNPMMNPQVRQMMNIVQQSGMSAKDLFYQKAREMGISNPDEYLRQNGMDPTNM